MHGPPIQSGQVGLVAMVGNPYRRGTALTSNPGRWDLLAMVGNPPRALAENWGCLQEGHLRKEKSHSKLWCK